MSEPIRPIAGVLAPLFSLRSERSLGIGEIGDLPIFARWMADAGMRLIQLLPLGPLPDGETSPYAAASSFGIDSMYVSIDALEDVDPSDRASLFGVDGDVTIDRLRKGQLVDYAGARAIKRRFLRAGFERFFVREWETNSGRAKQLRDFIESQNHWLPDFALFRALKARYGGGWWLGWPDALRARQPEALARARTELGRSALGHAYAQWIAHEQWETARRMVREMGVELMGDLPFVIGFDSADVWSHQSEFFGNATLGVPGDQFNPAGQDWGLPAYDWSAMDRDGLEFVRSRAAAMGHHFDRFRVDHLVGYYRMYVRPKGAEPRFVPATEPEQIARGEGVMKALIKSAASTGARIVAEDLGVIPPFVRASLKKLDLPGYKVLMWEKQGDSFIDPTKYPRVSLATSGTHDTETLATWWEALPEADRAHAISDIAALAPLRKQENGTTFDDRVHAALMKALMGAGSELTLLPYQDLVGSHARVNTPGTVGVHNWTWRLPATVDALRADADTTKKLVAVSKAIRASGR